MLYNIKPNSPYFITFVAQLKNRRLHINQILGFFLLWVFAIALTPWSSLHHHEEEQEYCVKDGKNCMHKVHIGNETHNCLICSAHFEKDYHNSTVSYNITLESKIVLESTLSVSAAYTALISTSLRGPPLA